MFTKKTAFILGAGASWHYGYPTGEDLVKKVIAKSESVGRFFRDSFYQNPIFPNYVTDKCEPNCPVQQKQDAWKVALNECTELAERLKQVNPLLIDYFLGQNQQLQSIGKLIIALVILECEAVYLKQNRNANRGELLERTPRKTNQNAGDGLDLKKVNDDWHRFIVHKLASNCVTSASLKENQVTFVTFNYDVSLEFSLYNALNAIQLFRKPDVDQFLAEGRVLHVYGKVRDYPATQFTPIDPDISLDIPYGSPGEAKRYHECKKLLDDAYSASRQLRVIDPHDKMIDEKIVGTAQKAVEDAECVYVLGYGFDESNSKRLGLDKALRLDGNRKKAVLFTNFGDINRINKKASRLFFGTFDDFLPPRAILGSPDGGFYYEKSTRNVYEALELDFDSLEE